MIVLKWSCHTQILELTSVKASLAKFMRLCYKYKNVPVSVAYCNNAFKRLMSIVFWWKIILVSLVDVCLLLYFLMK